MTSYQNMQITNISGSERISRNDFKKYYAVERTCPMEAAARGSSSKDATRARQSAPSSASSTFSSWRRGITSAPARTLSRAAVNCTYQRNILRLNKVNNTATPLSLNGTAA
jgi:hypothetical protein